MIRFTPGKRLMIWILITAACMLVGAIVVAIICYKGATPARMRLATLAQDVIMFILPALLTALVVSTRPWHYLRVSTPVPMLQGLIAVLGLIVAIPALNAVVAWNEAIELPDILNQAENRATDAVDMLMGGTGVGDLVLGILLVGCLAGVSEEFFFRGALQRLLASCRGTDDPTPALAHVAIWVTAIVFSAFHMQFMGFFPRLLLGAYFGYTLYWTRSLWVPVTLHAVNNSIVVVSDWCNRSQITTSSVDEVGADSWPMVLLSVLLFACALVAMKKIAVVRNFD